LGGKGKGYEVRGCLRGERRETYTFPKKKGGMKKRSAKAGKLLKVSADSEGGTVTITPSVLPFDIRGPGNA